MANSFSVKDKVDESERVEKKVIGGDSMLGQDRVEKKVYYPISLSPDSHPHFSRIWYARHGEYSGIFIMLTFESESHVLLPLHHSSQC